MTATTEVLDYRDYDPEDEDEGCALESECDECCSTGGDLAWGFGRGGIPEQVCRSCYAGGREISDSRWSDALAVDLPELFI